MLSSDLVYAVRPFVLALLLPPTPALLLALIGGWYTWRRRRAGALSLLLGIALCWLSCCERFAEFAVRHLLDPPPPLAPAQIERLAAERSAGRAVAVLVLGGGIVVRAPEYSASDLNAASIERLRYGLSLGRRIVAPVGFSGGVGHGRDPAQQPEAEIARRIAADEFGVVLRWVEARARNTGENASFSVQLLARDKVECIVVVSHREHLPRVLRAFHRAADGGLEVVAAGVGYRDTDSPFTWGDWIPSTHGLRKSRAALTEWLGWIAGL